MWALSTPFFIVLQETAGAFGAALAGSLHPFSTILSVEIASRQPLMTCAQDKVSAVPDFPPEENRFVGNGFFSGENVRDVPHALHLAQQQVHAILVQQTS